MCPRWNLGALVAVAVAIVVAVSSGADSQSSEPRATTATEVTFAIESDGLALNIAHGNLAVTLKL